MLYPSIANFDRTRYSYRLCSLESEKLDEECFQKTPLKFVGKASLRWGGVGGERAYYDPVALGEYL